MTAARLIALGQELCRELRPLTFKDPVHVVYNPLDYAWPLYEQYLQRYAAGTKRVLFLGMNPGPWGMAQTGVPFGEISAVRDWLGLGGKVGKPEHEHPKRPVLGLDCPRSEVSGRRLWGLFKKRFGTPQRFFENHFVLNYCPLVFMEASGKNITPDKLAADERAPVGAACDAHLARAIDTLQPRCLVGVGKYAEGCLRRVTDNGFIIGSILHPSPASPAANRDFEATALCQLRELGVWPGP
jgi:single-strand selective monofunctional uracil DNA glycosylase